MLSDCSVVLTHENCDWTGNLVPSRVQVREEAEIGAPDQAWFRCPRCQNQWEVRVTDDAVVVVPAVESGGRIGTSDESQPGPESELFLSAPCEAAELTATI